MRPALIAIAMLAPACWLGGVAPSPPADAPAVAAGEPRAPRIHSAKLVATTELSDGGLVVAATGSGAALGDAGCAPHEDHLLVARLAPTGRAMWSRCVAPTEVYMNARTVMVAASPHVLWLVRTVDPDAPEHVHGDVHDMVVVERWSLDGVPIDARVAMTWRDGPGPDTEKRRYFRHQTLRLAGAGARGDELVLGGDASAGAVVDGRWELRGDAVGDYGFVLEVPATGPVRAIVDERGATIESFAVAGRAFVAAGRCWQQFDPACPRTTGPYVLTGDLDGPTRRTHFVASEFGTARAAIDRTGNVAAALALYEPVTVDGADVVPQCGDGPQYVMIALWDAGGALRYARALGDCSRGAEVAARDMDVLDLALAAGRPLVALAIQPRGTGGPWPIHFDHHAVAASPAVSGAVLELDDRGEVARVRSLRPMTDDDTSDDPDLVDGIDHVAVVASPRAWLAVEHTGALRDGDRVTTQSGIELLRW